MKAETFLATAQQFGQAALDDFAHSHGEAAALHFGVMLEHLAKAYLVGQHPAYIVDAGAGKSGFDNLLLACGHTKHVKPGHRPRTITLHEALVRFGQMNPPFQVTPELRRVIDARDGSAHAAGNPPDLAEIVHTALRTAQALLKALAIGEAPFWGGYAHTVTALLSKHDDELRTNVQLRIAAAARNFADRYRDLDPAQLQLLKAAIQTAITSTTDDEGWTEVDCPACANVGLLLGATEIRWRHHEYVDGDTGEMAILDLEGDVYMLPEQFRCPFCQLTLDNEDELAIVDLLAEVHVRRANPDEQRAWHYDQR
ncbi:hypothetical protein [Catellatospora methionotrophica]|uniref:hypothetical protein n=1 Tax=Catellatospora methionotrophica TaxID=121620 RepID=UPI0033D41E59